MANKPLTKLEPAPLAFPNGGGLKAMTARKNEIKDKQIKLAHAKHELELAKIEQQHRATLRTGAKPATRSSSNG